ncbi:MAG: recombinase family protein [Halobacteriaceae archaeon]
MTEAVGYTRLSQDGMSIPEQKFKIRDYCDRHDLELRKIYDDGTHSSGYETDERPEYKAVRELVRQGEIGAVVVRDTGRIGRDFDERMYFVLDCRQAGVELHSDEFGRHDLSDPWSVLQETAQAAGDDVQKRKEIERSKEATKERIESGCYHGTPPIGLQFADDNCHLEKNEREWKTVCDIIERRARGDPVQDVADDTDVSVATVSRVANRGYQWYQEKLAEYGQ